jgi:hypothetical protein
VIVKKLKLFFGFIESVPDFEAKIFQDENAVLWSTRFPEKKIFPTFSGEKNWKEKFLKKSFTRSKKNPVMYVGVVLRVRRS